MVSLRGCVLTKQTADTYSRGCRSSTTIISTLVYKPLTALYPVMLVVSYTFYCCVGSGERSDGSVRGFVTLVERDADLCAISVQMDVTSRESILEVKKLIQEKEGKLHILVNKYVGVLLRMWLD